MKLEDIKLTEADYNKIAAILDTNFGEVTLQTLNDETFIIFVATVLDASYRVGFQAGAESVDKK
jgi:hypothetical protein